MIAPNSELTKLDPKEELNARERKLLRAVISCNMNETQAAKKLGTVQQNVFDRMRRLEKKLGFQRLMDHMGISDARIAQKVNEGLEATKPISCNVHIKDKTSGKSIGEMVEAGEATKDFIDVEDYSTRHKYVDTALKLKRHLGTDVNVNVDNSKHLNILNVNLEEVDSKDLIDVIFGRGESAG